ncbi:MAG: arginine--tRNA ligase [Planctomycetota bacterium]|jgi:arginyl-tRNA synthetase|nr:arginine--tRNA ligase [Planctomycetota bacterium]
MNLNDLYAAAADLLAAKIDLPAAEIRAALVQPPQPEMGDLGFPCFTLAKKLRAAPPKIAADLAAQISASELFAKIAAVGGYVNFTISPAALGEIAVKAALAADWGASSAGNGKTVVIDFSSPNIAKPLAVHHIRSTMLGAALARLYATTGWRVVTINHLGDWGTNFGQLMVAYTRAKNSGETPATDLGAQLKLYLEFHQAAETNSVLEEEARAWFKKLEDGDAETVKMWKIFVDESVKGLQKLYDRLNVKFDHYTGESFFNDKMAATQRRLQESGLLVKSDGALVVELQDVGIDAPCLIQKTDGATTYATRDLAAAEYRRREYNFDKCLYVVANQQELHFRQIFAILKKMGYAWADGCEHVKFGMLSFAAGVFGEERATGSTRKGQIIFLDDVLARAVEKAREIIDANGRDDEVKNNAGRLAEQVGVGAVIFSEFMQRRQKDVLFSWDKALNMQGDSGPYLQYTHARLSSLIAKSGVAVGGGDAQLLTSALSRAVLLTLAEFPRVLLGATAENEPSRVAEYLLELCAVFNRLYADKKEHQIITADAARTAARIDLVAAVRNTLRRGLAVLGIAAPEKM